MRAFRQTRRYVSAARSWFAANRKDVFTLVILLGVTGALIVLFLYVPQFRPYVVVLVAAAGAIFTALPTVISDTAFVRWVTAVVCGLFVGAGTWYTAVDLERAKSMLQEQLNVTTHRLEVFHTALVASIGQTTDDQNETIGRVANMLQSDFAAGRYADVLQLTSLLSEVYPENGHSLYYMGEVHRVRRNLEDMRGAFKRYLAKSHVMPESRVGVAAECYERASGYCGERTAWIDHMMANDTYRSALRLSDGPERVREMERAWDFANDALEIRPSFESTTSLDATDVVKQKAAQDYQRLTNRELNEEDFHPASANN